MITALTGAILGAAAFALGMYSMLLLIALCHAASKGDEHPPTDE